MAKNESKKSVKKSVQDKAEEARARLRKRRGGLHVGIDPTVLVDLIEIGGYHFEAGTREFGAWSRQMIADVGEKARPYLKIVWGSLKAVAEERRNKKLSSIMSDSQRDVINRQADIFQDMEVLPGEVKEVSRAEEEKDIGDPRSLDWLENTIRKDFGLPKISDDQKPPAPPLDSTGQTTVPSPIIFWLLKVPLLVGIVLLGWFLVALIGTAVLGIQPGRVNGLQSVLLGGGGVFVAVYGNRIANRILRRFRPKTVKTK